MVDWKKEVKLSDLVGGKKKQQDAAAPEAVEAVVQADKPEQTSIWKKELSFGRKKQPKAEPVEDTPEVEEQTLELDAPAAVELVQHYAPEPVAAEPHVELVPEPVEQVFPVAVPDLEPDTDVQFVDLLTASLPEAAAPAARAPRPRPPSPRPHRLPSRRSLPSPHPHQPLHRPRRPLHPSSSTRPFPPRSCPRFPTSPSPRSRRRRKSRRRRACRSTSATSPSGASRRARRSSSWTTPSRRRRSSSARAARSRSRARLHGPAGVASTRSDSSA